MADKMSINSQADEYHIIRCINGEIVFDQKTRDANEASYLLAEAQIAQMPFDLEDEEVKEMFPELSVGFPYYESLNNANN